MKDLFLKLDIFKKLPKDLTEPTFCGAVVSMLCTVLLVLLGMSEFRTYFEPSTSSGMLIQTQHNDDKFHINLDIEMPFMPCDVVGLDVEDSMGYHIVDYYSDLKKARLDADGNVISVENMSEKQAPRDVLLKRIRGELEAGQGCRFQGFIEVNRVPGNFHIGHHAFGDIIQVFTQEGTRMNNSYKINHLSFGDYDNFSKIKRRFPDTDLQHPLDGFARDQKNGKNMRSMFALNAVPSIFESDFGFGDMLASEVFQLAVHHEHQHGIENILVFNYRVSPVAVHYSNSRENLAQFLINICAIIGGIFTVAGIVDSIIHKSSKMFLKESMNKLS